MRTPCLSALLLALCGCGRAAGYPVDLDVPATADRGVVAADVRAAVCVAGRTKACPCPSGGAGAQTCSADGTFGACACLGVDASVEGDAIVAQDVVSGVDATVGGDVIIGSSPDAGARTFDFVVNRMLLDEGAEPGVTTRAFYGFNLDGRFSPSRTASQGPADCSHGDYFSTVDPDQNMGSCFAGAAGGGSACHGGVDNQLPNLAQTVMQFQASLNVQRALDDSINRASLLMLIRVSDVNGALDSTLDDPSVTVRVYTVVHPTFADCANIQVGYQTYAVDNLSLTSPGDLDSATFQYAGSIVHGRLRVNAATSSAASPTFRIAVPAVGVVGSPSFVVSLYQTALRVDLSSMGGANGNMGGYLRQTDVISALTTIPALMAFRDAAGPLIQGFVDIATGAGTSCESPSGGIGVGLGFTALPAVIAPATVSGAVPRTCGSGS